MKNRALAAAARELESIHYDLCCLYTRLEDELGGEDDMPTHPGMARRFGHVIDQLQRLALYVENAAARPKKQRGSRREVRACTPKMP